MKKLILIFLIAFSVNAQTGKLIKASKGTQGVKLTTSNYTATADNLTGHLQGINNAMGLKANIASPIFTGTPTAPIPTTTNGIATKGYADGLNANNVKLTGDQTISGVLTLNDQLRLGNGASSLSPSILFPDDIASDTGINHINDGEIQFLTNNLVNSTIDDLGVKSIAFIKTGGSGSQFLKADGSSDNTLYAPINSPTFTGTPTAPTAPTGTNTTQIATTAFVLANSGGTSGAFIPTNQDSFTYSKSYWIKIGDIVEVTINGQISGLSTYSSTITLPNSFTINTPINDRVIGTSGVMQIGTSNIFPINISENTTNNIVNIKAVPGSNTTFYFSIKFSVEVN